MVTKKLLALVVVLPLLTSACGGKDEAEAKQAALAPANPAAPKPATDSTAQPVAPTPVAADSATVAAATPVDSAASENEQLGRESFSYTGGSRDPFVSLLANTKVGPELPDLTLVAIYYDTRSPNASVVVMREKINNKKYNLRPGDRLGRMRVSNVRPKDVTFTIDDFGTERQETVSLRKQEDNQ